MRATQHSSRTNAAGQVHGRKHNDRNFDVGKADNIDQSKMGNNLYWSCYGGKYIESEKDDKMSFAEVELKAYEALFGKQLEATNANYIKQRYRDAFIYGKKLLRIQDGFCIQSVKRSDFPAIEDERGSL